MVRDNIVVCEWVVFELLLVLPDHAEEFPVGVARVDVLLDCLLLKNLSLLGTTLLTVLF